MKVKVFYPDRDGRIHFTKEELQALLDEVYKEGYNDAKPYYWQSPYWSNSGTITTTPYITYSSSNNVSSSNNLRSTATTVSNKDVPFTYTTTGQTLVANGEDIPAPQEYQIKFETVET